MGNFVNSPQTKKILPFIQSSDRLKVATLNFWDGPELTEISIDSDDWFLWLHNEQSFRLTYNFGGRSVSINILSERSQDARRVYSKPDL